MSTKTNANSTNPYLEGNYGPVHEERTETDLPVVGRLPENLDGRYLHNGPNPIGTPDPATHNWFMGTGMVHGIRLRDGRAEWYRNRYVRSAEVSKALGEPPHPGPVFAGFDFPANTNVIGHSGRTFAIVEGGGRPYELDDHLGSVGPCDFDGTLPGGYTAHPLVDPVTGELHAVSYFFGWGNRVQYSVIGTDGRVRKTVDIEVGGSPMMHAFSLTESYVVIYDLPVTFDAHKAAQVVPGPLARGMEAALSRAVGRVRIPPAIIARLGGGTAASATLPYSWNPDYPARVGLLPREGGSPAVRWFEVEPCYVYHPLNAYDDGDRVVLDVTRHPKTYATDDLGPVEGVPTFDRWTVDPVAGKVIEERLDDRGQEFPRHDDRLVGRRNRYGYTIGFDDASPGDFGGANRLIRHDLGGGKQIAREFGAGVELDEFVFVPSSADAAEDDGVVMGFAYNKQTDRSDLRVLDSQTLEDVATVQLPARVPHGFHGNWVPTGR